MSDYDDEQPSGNPYADLDEHYKPFPALELVHAMAGAKQAKEELEERLKQANRVFDYLRLKAVPNKFEEEGIENMKVEGVGRVSLTGDMYVRVPAGAKPAFFAWLRDTGRESLIKEDVNASTLKAAAKEWLKKGEDLPTDLIKVEPFTRASITKTK